MKKHCCQLMENSIKDSKGPIKYAPSFREYYMNLIGNAAIQCIFFCPWCSLKFPKDLRDEFLDIFYDELNLDLVQEFHILETPELPEEFKSEEWWKKRGL